VTTALVPLATLEAGQLRPLLEHESQQWLAHLGWEHGTPAEYLTSAARAGRVGGWAMTLNSLPLAYAYYVPQADKTIVGGVHGLPDSNSHRGVRRVLDATLTELIDDGQSSRIESQLIYFGKEQPAGSFEERGFGRFERAFLAADLSELGRKLPPPEPSADRRQMLSVRSVPDAARIVHRSFAGSREQQMSTCYQSTANCQVFLESVVRRQACGRLEPDASFLLLEQGRPAGVVVISTIGPRSAHVVQISVDPAQQRQGLGSAMLSASVDRLLEAGFSRLTLSVSLHNVNAHRWYRKLSFRELKLFSAFAWSR
jgi:ribosomal protein S18 acetylase RimI-like enzyme